MSGGGHIGYQPKGRGNDVELEVDYVVIGSGAGGASVARDLTLGGASVALVEAGAWRSPTDYPSSMYGTMRDMMDDWNTSITMGRALWPIVQASTVGGTTVINSAIVVRTPGDVFESWQSQHGIGGDGMAEAVWSYQDEIEQHLSVEHVPPEALGRSNELIIKASKALDFHDHDMRRNVKSCVGSGQCIQGCRADRKRSMNVTYIPEAIEAGMTLLSCAPAHKVVFEGKRAIGARGHFKHPLTRKRGASFFVRGRRATIVAASATHSPTLLLRSGVKNKALGSAFRAHPGTGIFGVYPERVDMNVGATQGWASTKFRDNGGFKLESLSIPLELVASRLSGGGKALTERMEDFPYIAMWCMAVRAEDSVGRVRRGVGGRPMVNYTMHPKDMLRLREGAHKVAQMHRAAGATAIIPGIFGLPYKLAPDEIDVIAEGPLDPKAYVAILSHLFGGCPMGADPATSVVDGDGRVHGYEDLLVADASAFPSTIGVNPQHSIMAIARLRARQLLEA